MLNFTVNSTGVNIDGSRFKVQLTNVSDKICMERILKYFNLVN